MMRLTADGCTGTGKRAADVAILQPHMELAGVRDTVTDHVR
jgi:hypothetical protein